MGAVFLGEHQHQLDTKSRLMVPAKFRDVVSEEHDGYGFYLTRGLDGCLIMYTPARWKDMMAEISEARFTRKEVRHFQRLMFSKAEHVVPDAAGRILIPAGLKQLAGLSKEVTVVGLSDKIEIWDRKTWVKLEEEQTGRFEDIAEQLFDEK